MTRLPGGTVTFLFTDIEGSTRLVQALGEGYAKLLAQHHRIMRDAIAIGGGHEVRTEGDSFFAVFVDASGAVGAAVAAQRALAAHDWPEGSAIRVRMGLHTGQGVLSGGDYVGLDVHRAARIAAAGHGGQVLLSGEASSLAGPRLPADIRSRDLGPHRLKDLARPEHLYQLEIEGLTNEFPTLRTLDARPNNLPIQLTSFVGRETDIAAVGELLDRARLATLTGPGGTGKTRLALQVAAERLSRYADGAFFVELAPITDAGLVVYAVASALGVRESSERSLAATLGEHLRDRELLLVLDNFEQVADAAPLITDMLTGAARLRVLVTSRAVLHVHGEHEYPVPPLAIPDPASLPPLEALSQYEAVVLFIERARATRPDFAVTVESAPVVAEIVARLDGLPLAVELAAAKCKLLAPSAILSRLGSRLAFLGGGARDLPARQQTLRNAIAWSYELLPPPEQGLFTRLAVFVGGWTVEAADAVAAPRELGIEAFDGLASLVDQSLIRAVDTNEGDPRFTMLETIREYALERLADGGEVDAVRRRHAEHFLTLAESLEPELAESAAAIARVDTDHDNFRAALAWGIDADEAALGLRLGYALWRYWQVAAHLREGRDWFERLLALPSASARTVERAKGLEGAGGIAYWQNDYAAATSWYDESESIYREVGGRRDLARALYNTLSMAAIAGDMDRAAQKTRDGEAIARELGDDGLLNEFLAADGYAAFMTNDLPRARALLEESLELAERSGVGFAIGVAHHTVAQVARLQGRYDDAAAHYRAAVRVFHELGNVAQVTEPLQGLAAVAVATGGADRGVRLLGANVAVRERIGGGPPPEWLRLGDPLADARTVLTEQEYEAAWRAGLGMSVEDAVAEALAS
jgi:predicted ATPase/class 3 adenylate cyclase